MPGIVIVILYYKSLSTNLNPSAGHTSLKQSLIRELSRCQYSCSALQSLDKGGGRLYISSLPWQRVVKTTTNQRTLNGRRCMSVSPAASHQVHYGEQAFIASGSADRSDMPNQWVLCSDVKRPLIDSWSGSSDCRRQVGPAFLRITAWNTITLGLFML